MTQTQGEYRVGIDFNPSGDERVNQIKRAAADLIDLIATVPLPTSPVSHVLPGPGHQQHVNEVARLKALAMTQAEEAAMWAVKAATKREPGD